jgi:hypothetical protein
VKTLLSTIILASIIAANPSQAQVANAPMLTLPTVETVTMDSVEYKCLDVVQWKGVLLIANEYQSLYRWRLITQGTLDAYKVQTETYDKLINNYLSQIKLLKDDREYLTLRLNTEMDSALKLKKKDNVERGILWGVIALETIMLGVFGVMSVAQQ